MHLEGPLTAAHRLLSSVFWRNVKRACRLLRTESGPRRRVRPRLRAVAHRIHHRPANGAGATAPPCLQRRPPSETVCHPQQRSAAGMQQRSRPAAGTGQSRLGSPCQRPGVGGRSAASATGRGLAGIGTWTGVNEDGMLTGGTETGTERGRWTGGTETGKGAEMGTGTGTTSALAPLLG